MEVSKPVWLYILYSLMLLPKLDGTVDSCGNRPLVLDYGTMRIVGGVDAQPGAWPWLVSIQMPSKKGHKHSCGGSLLNENWALTAAHCFKSSRKAWMKWRIVIGAYQLSELTSDVQIRTIRSYKQHEQYNPRVEANDIAIIEFNEPVVYNDFAQPACLPSPTMVTSKFHPCYISGWGVMTEGADESADILQEAKVNQIDVKKCNGSRWYNGAIKAYNLCAGYEEGGVDSCQGDSGGPLMCYDVTTSRFYVIGVFTWGRGSSQSQNPVVYTNTQYFLEWILEKIGAFKSWNDEFFSGGDGKSDSFTPPETSSSLAETAQQLPVLQQLLYNAQNGYYIPSAFPPQVGYLFQPPYPPPEAFAQPLPQPPAPTPLFSPGLNPASFQVAFPVQAPAPAPVPSPAPLTASSSSVTSVPSHSMLVPAQPSQTGPFITITQTTMSTTPIMSTKTDKTTSIKH
ncbi:acrosin-like [Ambystoma mexicanum]|uniref:acrosin-like n=1 Tax=Ambystoma mexicanum TaxID=8296 RepID=UPI0037E8B2E8